VCEEVTYYSEEKINFLRFRFATTTHFGFFLNERTFQIFVMLLLWCKQSYQYNQPLPHSIITRGKKINFSFFIMCSIDCLLCRLVQKVFLILATVKGSNQKQVNIKFSYFEILFPEVILRCKLPPSKSTIWMLQSKL
jgi:hypothetical protein